MAVASRDETMLRRGEAARRLGVHPNTLVSWAKKGWLTPAQRLPGGEARYREDEVEALRERLYS